MTSCATCWVRTGRRRTLAQAWSRRACAALSWTWGCRRARSGIGRVVAQRPERPSQPLFGWPRFLASSMRHWVSGNRHEWSSPFSPRCRGRACGAGGGADGRPRHRPRTSPGRSRNASSVAQRIRWAGSRPAGPCRSRPGPPSAVRQQVAALVSGPLLAEPAPSWGSARPRRADPALPPALAWSPRTTVCGSCSPPRSTGSPESKTRTVSDGSLSSSSGCPLGTDQRRRSRLPVFK